MNRFRIWFCDANPNLIDPCEYTRRQKVKGRWDSEAMCGNRSFLKIQIIKDAHPTTELMVCRECLGKIIGEFVSILTYAD
jgi:hypothetical protein